jgi:hypothetical protein
MGQYSQRIDQYHPQRFIVGLHVHPDYRQQGIGGQLDQTLLEALAPFEPMTLRTFVYEDHPDDLHFWEQHAFTEFLRSGDAALDIKTFDFAPYGRFLLHLVEHNIGLGTYTELMARDTDCHEKLNTLHNTLMQDVPPRGMRTPMTTEEFVRTRI